MAAVTIFSSTKAKEFGMRYNAYHPAICVTSRDLLRYPGSTMEITRGKSDQSLGAD